MYHLLLAALLAVPPLSVEWTAVCSPTRCLVTARSTTPATETFRRWRYTFSDNRPDVYTERDTLSFPIGKDSLYVRVYGTRASDQRIYYRSRWLKAGKAPAPGAVIHDTIFVTLPRIHDTVTIRVPSPPVHDTITIRLPGIHDTITVQLPGIHDTITIRLPAPPPIHDTIIVRPPAIHDTITVRLPAPPPVYIHDTITVSTALPILPPGIVITDPNGERGIYFNNQYLGRLVLQSNNTVDAVRFSFGMSLMKVQGNYPTQVQAIAALLAPPPAGWTP